MRYTSPVPPRVLGVLGGNDVDNELLRAWATSAEVVYAADSGADRLIALGFSPIVVGDFDSFSSLPQSSHLRLVQSIDQTTTDCDKLLALVKSDGHMSVTLAATEGDLPDHVLSTYASAMACSIDVQFAFRRGIGVLVRDGASLRTTPGRRVSLIPLVPCSRVSLEGVAWPLKEAEIEPGGATSISNEAVGKRVTVSLSSGCALLFVETREVVW
jgi:thiamine pyrophosphokinase